MKIKNRSATERSRAIHDLYKHFPKNTFKTYIVDSGKEFACYSKIETDLKVPIYFVDASSSWGRGSHENAKGFLGENFLKQINLTHVSDEAIHGPLFLINSRPRTCLGWKTS